jgi:hypothetical protein
VRALLLVLAAGCADHDLCAGHDGTCIGLVVNGQGIVDQLQIQMRGAAQLDGRTPEAAGAPHVLPVSTALFLPAVGGAVDLTVSGLLGGDLVGQAMATAVVRPGQHQNLQVTLAAVHGDLAVADLPADLGADLAESADQSLPEADLSQPDLLQPDLVGFNPRYVFLLPARGSVLGTHAALDNDCTVEATSAGLPAVAYKAVIAYPPSDDPALYLSLAQHRVIIRPDGTQVATDDNFFSASGTHLAEIDELADGTVISAGCAYTNFGFTGLRINSPSDCVGWTDNGSGVAGTTGDIKSIDTHWSFQTPILTCDQLMCHVYCIQQD